MCGEGGGNNKADLHRGQDKGGEERSTSPKGANTPHDHDLGYPIYTRAPRLTFRVNRRAPEVKRRR